MLQFLRRKEPVTSSTPALIVVVQRAGTAGKSTATALFQASIELSGLPSRIVEFDDQRRHGNRLPGLVTSVTLPPTTELQGNAEADMEVLNEAYAATRASFSRRETVIWDTGANLDDRAVTFFAGVDVASEVPDGMPIVVVIMVRCDAEMIRLAKVTEEAFRRAIPSATIAIGLNDVEHLWSNLRKDDPIAKMAEEVLGPIIKRGGSIIIRAMPPRLATALRESHVPWTDLATMDTDVAMEHWGVGYTVAKSRQGELSLTLEQTRQEVVRQLGFPESEV